MQKNSLVKISKKFIVQKQKENQFTPKSNGLIASKQFIHQLVASANKVEKW